MAKEDMELSITTDYVKSSGDPSPYLKAIADSGFTHIHWCHQWNTDFLYSNSEIEQIQRWLRDYGLQLLDLHGSVGVEKNWASPKEYERQAGVELVKNRIEMTARLHGDVVNMHIPVGSPLDSLRRSLDELMRFAEERNVRIALENGNFKTISGLLSEYSRGYLGLCYDSGHANLDPNGLDHLENLKDRLISIHLNDNDGNVSLHNLLFTGTIDWPRVAATLAHSAYAKCVSMEVMMRNSGIVDETVFLRGAFETGERFSRMLDKLRMS